MGREGRFFLFSGEEKRGIFFSWGERRRGGEEEKLKSAYSENLFCSDIVFWVNYVSGGHICT